MVKTKETIKVEPVVKAKKMILVMDLGGSLKKGDSLNDDQYTQLIGAGFTDEQLFGN